MDKIKNDYGQQAVVKLSSKNTNLAGCFLLHPANSNDALYSHANIDFAYWGRHQEAYLRSIVSR